VYIDGVRTEQVKAGHVRLLIAGTARTSSCREVTLRSAVRQTRTNRLPAGRLRAVPDQRWLSPQTQSAAVLSATIFPVAGTKHTVTVAADNSGDYPTVQEGIDGSHGFRRNGSLIKPGCLPRGGPRRQPHVKMEGAGDRPDQVTIVFGKVPTVQPALSSRRLSCHRR